MTATRTDWTAEEVRALPDDRRRYEVLDGELWVAPTPSPAHQLAVGRLFILLNKYLEQHGIGEAMPSPSDLEFSAHRMLQPDVFAYPVAEGQRPNDWKDILPLLLAVEVTSPTTARVDRLTKRLIYQSERIPEYWIVDLDARLVERWRPDDKRPQIIGDILAWNLHPNVPALLINLQDIFAR